MYFKLRGIELDGLSQGPFGLNRSLSLRLTFKELNKLLQCYHALIKGGKVFMPFETQNNFGWIQDQFGLSWQFTLASEERLYPIITFNQERFPHIKDVIKTYEEVFLDVEVIKHKALKEVTEIKLFDLNVLLWAWPIEDGFTEGFSLKVMCNNQAEVDRYWALSRSAYHEACGWLKDPFGISFQIVPKIYFDVILSGHDPTMQKMFDVVFSMKKLLIADIMKAIEL